MLIAVEIERLALRYTDRTVHNKDNNLYRETGCIKTFEIVSAVQFRPLNKTAHSYQYVYKHLMFLV
jgi:hypothetical protein